ncbi:hypothetical protein JKF63_03850 [Porcisia hertigi]|uniref:Uncharacterized protein n=1 Tax=Porcisia hertigi TaxID=2761500 RepID=A0A836L7F0_9TRYP|nr:hypothetical protein JKF63_03850 [Porcisia hertigi]
MNHSFDAHALPNTHEEVAEEEEDSAKDIFSGEEYHGTNNITPSWEEEECRCIGEVRQWRRRATLVTAATTLTAMASAFYALRRHARCA